MATRFASPSLRRRFAWTLASIAAIGLVSGVSMTIYRQARNAPPAPAVAAVPEVKPVNAAEKKTDQKTDRQPTQPEPPPGPKLAGDFHSARYGYTVALEGTQWSRWEDLAQIVPEAEWGALLNSYGRFLVIPVSLGDLDPRPEALDHALLARLGIAYPSDRLSEFQTVERQGVMGHSFQLTRDVAGAENDYRLWVLRRGDIAYLAAAWLDRSAAGGAAVDAAVLDDALGRLSFDAAPPPSPRTESLNAFQRQAHGNIYNDLGLSAFNARDFSGAIDCFRRAFELQPNDPAILTNLVNSHVELKQFRQALAELDPHINRFPNQPDLWAGRAFLLAELGETEAAASAYAALFATGYWAEAPFTQYITLLAENDRGDEALAAVERFLQAKDSFAVRRLQASLYRQRGDHEQAVAILARLAQNRPFSAELEYDLAESFLTTNRFQESLDVCRQLLDHRYDTAHTYLLQARGQYGLKWYAEAKSSLEAAIKREPANKDAQELLQLVSGMLGEGNNGAIQEAIDPVPLPEQFSNQDNTAASRGVADSGLNEFGAYYTSRQVAISFQAGKEFKLTDRRTIRVADASGVQRFSTIQVPFDPLGEQLYVNRLHVTDGQGKEVAVGKSSDYYVIDGSRSDAPTHGKLLNIPVPGLQPGSTIELVLTRRDLAPPSEFPYTAHIFSSEVPVLSAVLFVAADESEIKYQTSPGVHQEHAEEGLAWSINNPMVYRSEPLQPARSTFLPGVIIGSSKTTWDRLAKEYLASIADRTTPDAEIQSLAKQLTEGASDDEARTIALVRYVQNDLTYKAVEFGRHARVPSVPADVVKAKYGDCKDHALLLVQLLGACHIKAYLTLANLDAPVDPQFASLEQFNHVLVYVPGFGGGKCFDCTEKDADLISIPAPVDLGGEKVFVLDNSQPRFIDLPDYGLKSSRLAVNRTVRVVNQADASVEETVTVTGYHAAFLRGMFKGVAVADRAATLQTEIAPLGGGMQVQSLAIEHLADRNQPLVFKAVYLVRGRFQAADDALVGQIPALWEQMYLEVPPVRTRRTPFEVEYPLEFSSTVEFIAPKGFAIEPPASADNRNESVFAVWKIHTTPNRQGLKAQYELQLNSGRYPASDYSRYSEDFSRANAALSQSVVLKRAK